MYLKKIPGREADAEATLAKYYGYDVESNVEQTKVEHKSVEQQKVTTPLRQTEPDKTGYKSDGFTTDDEPNELSRLYERKSRKKPKKKLTPVEGKLFLFLLINSVINQVVIRRLRHQHRLRMRSLQTKWPWVSSNHSKFVILLLVFLN